MKIRIEYGHLWRQSKIYLEDSNWDSDIKNCFHAFFARIFIALYVIRVNINQLIFIFNFG